MMREMIISELTQAMQEFARGIAHFLPRLLVMLVIALLGWVCAYLVKVVLRRVLRLVKFDRLSENAGAAHLLTQAALPTSTELLSRLVFWITWFGIVLAGLSALGIVGLQELISRFLLFLPRLLASVLIFVVGLIAASFLSRAALLAAVNANLRPARALSSSIRVIILALTLSMSFEEVGVAEHTILVAFSIVFGAAMSAIAIAFGLGGRHLARRALEKRFSDGERQETKEDELSAL